MFRADLHCHTSCSDGSDSPQEVLLKAKEIGLSGLAITDHDSINAYKTAITVAKEQGILLGSGIELSSQLDDDVVHILGYDFDLNAQSILAICDRHKNRRKYRNLAILEKLKKKGFLIEEAELESMFPSTVYGRPHIAYLMQQKGFVKDIQEAFDLYLAEGKSCYDPGDSITVQETIDAIHSGGGKAFLAHPHIIKNNRFIKKLLEFPFDGIECYYSKCTPNLEQRWVAIAKERKLLISGGSDYHGQMRPNVPLGASWVNEESFHLIFQNLLVSP